MIYIVAILYVFILKLRSINKFKNDYSWSERCSKDNKTSRIAEKLPINFETKNGDNISLSVIIIYAYEMNILFPPTRYNYIDRVVDIIVSWEIFNQT